MNSEKSMFGHLKDMFGQGTSIFKNYKDMTPTKNDSTLETMKYAYKNRNHTYKLFGFDTGIKDYGAQVMRHPISGYKLKTDVDNFNTSKDLLFKRMENTSREINSNPVTRHGFNDH